MPTPHSSTHLLETATIVLGAASLIAVVRNRVIRRRLLFSLVGGLAAVAVHALSGLGTGSWMLANYGWQIEQLVVVMAVSNAAIALVFNPWFRDGESDRAPAIVQDALVVAIVSVAAIPLFHIDTISFLTGSAIVAAIVGFAMQDTLGNAFAGIAIQIERPFRVGHWISVGDHVGLVTEVTWRATKIRTKNGNMVAVPNSVLSGSAVHNYSEPTAPSRLQVDVGIAYGHPPNEVREALLAAARGAPYVIADPPPDTMVVDFANSSIIYRLWFWIDDFSQDDHAMDAVRTRLYYELKRRNLEIPFPIQVEYGREEPAPDLAALHARQATSLARVPVFARLPEDAHRALAATAGALLFADGEVIMREGEPGGSMFVVDRGTVVLTVGPDGREVARIGSGGHFGEMALLTGDPRSATVRARGDVSVLEITADAFRAYVQGRPEVFEVLVSLATERRRELDALRATAGAAPAPTGPSLRARMKQYFGL